MIEHHTRTATEATAQAERPVPIICNEGDKHEEWWAAGNTRAEAERVYRNTLMRDRAPEVRTRRVVTIK